MKLPHHKYGASKNIGKEVNGAFHLATSCFSVLQKGILLHRLLQRQLCKQLIAAVNAFMTHSESRHQKVQLYESRGIHSADVSPRVNTGSVCCLQYCNLFPHIT